MNRKLSGYIKWMEPLKKGRVYCVYCGSYNGVRDYVRETCRICSLRRVGSPTEMSRMVYPLDDQLRIPDTASTVRMSMGKIYSFETVAP